jgi:hypothetical protein
MKDYNCECQNMNLKEHYPENKISSNSHCIILIEGIGRDMGLMQKSSVALHWPRSKDYSSRSVIFHVDM